VVGNVCWLGGRGGLRRGRSSSSYWSTTSYARLSYACTSARRRSASLRRNSPTETNWTVLKTIVLSDDFFLGRIAALDTSTAVQPAATDVVAPV